MKNCRTCKEMVIQTNNVVLSERIANDNGTLKTCLMGVVQFLYRSKFQFTLSVLKKELHTGQQKRGACRTLRKGSAGSWSHDGSSSSWRASGFSPRTSRRWAPERTKNEYGTTPHWHYYIIDPQLFFTNISTRGFGPNPHKWIVSFISMSSPRR